MPSDISSWTFFVSFKKNEVLRKKINALPIFFFNETYRTKINLTFFNHWFEYSFIGNKILFKNLTDVLRIVIFLVINKSVLLKNINYALYFYLYFIYYISVFKICHCCYFRASWHILQEWFSSKSVTRIQLLP